MSRHRLDPSNPNTFVRLLKEGRGQGEGENYRPWLTMQDLSSRGISSRLRGWRTGRRPIHVFSNLECNFFYTLEWDPTIVDYREQYLLDPQLTAEIASRSGLKHPTSPQSGRLFPMTTDFLVKRIVNGKPSYTAMAVKPFADVGPTATPRKAKRLAEKLGIEREFWKNNRIDGLPVNWTLVTENDFNPVLAKNIRAIHDYYHPNALMPLSGNMVEEIHHELFPRIAEEPLSPLASASDRKFGLKPGKSLSVACHLIARRRWPADLIVPLEFQKPLKLLS